METNITQSVLELNCGRESVKIENFVKKTVFSVLNKKGVILGISGGIDSSLTAKICVNALGKNRVYGLLMPEMESSPETESHSKIIIDFLDINYNIEDITPILKSLGCYKKRNESIKKLIPEFTEDWKFKIVLPDLINSDSYRLFSIVAQSPDGMMIKKRLDHKTYLEILSATNYKQRVRKMLEYYHADRLNFAVVGTPNRLEYDQGFFVKNGDGAADIKPIAHLYKSQVYQLARYYHLPTQILNHPPTTDTYSMPQSQEEFFFSVPYDILDFCLYCYDHDISKEVVARATQLSINQIQRVYNDINNKRESSKYLHLPAQIIK